MLDTVTPAVVRRVDYAPPAFLIDSVDLVFDLHASLTRVTSRLRVRRNPDATGATELFLHGEQLTLESVSIDGKPHAAYAQSDTGLSIEDAPDAFELSLSTICKPTENTSLSGLYVSNGNFFTQCEAEGFRRITYFIDRPDVMATYTVTLRADPVAYPVLLSNGNLVDEGKLGDGRHYARWEDPFPKPSYLFALVAGKLVATERRIRTGSGREKLLQVWVEPQDLPKTGHAMDSLVNAIRWDEARYGLELDLERFMIVAVSDFNMGAMENKGLNIFNTKYVLADAETATDADYENIEAVVGHEYFHNWTGNRVTCRDWFQLSLKEGLTVFRDQEFSADMAGAADPSAHATKRIDDVRVLRQMQFAEDAGPMAHPVRPESYVEINNFYTVTIYEKGGEVVRMYQTLLGREGFRKGMDLYFARHDGHAVTCDDFRNAMADANGRDLSQFELWYSQPGTPRVRVQTAHDAAAGTMTVTLSQTLGDGSAPPMLIPFAIGLVGADGADLPLTLAGESVAGPTTRVLEFSERSASYVFIGVSEAPLPSLLRNFSAPVIVEYEYGSEALAFLFAHDSDPFNRWEAGQRLATRELLRLTAQAAARKPLKLAQSVIDAFAQVLTDDTLAPAFREQALMLPAEAYLADQIDAVDPAAVHAARQFFRSRLADTLADTWRRVYEQYPGGAYRPGGADAGRRALKNLALSYLAEAKDPSFARSAAEAQYRDADNMTDRSAALAVLINLGGDSAQAALEDFYTRFRHEPLAIDKWFALQAARRASGDDRVLDSVRTLMQHPAFSIRNPNRARSLLFTFAVGNQAQFHAPDGSGYAFWAEQVLALDALNPQVSARLARAMERWRKYAPALRDQMRAALEQVAAGARSKDVLEVVNKALA
jgi:aminopeptidase N